MAMSEGSSRCQLTTVVSSSLTFTSGNQRVAGSSPVESSIGLESSLQLSKGVKSL